MRTKSLVTCLVGLVLLFASSSSAAEMRKWTRNNGKEFEAEFVKREGPVITLKKTDGTEFTLKMGQLSEDDRKYVNQLTRKTKEPTAQSAAPTWWKTGIYPLIAGDWDGGKIEQEDNVFVADSTYIANGVEVHWHGDGVISTDGTITIKGLYTPSKNSETSAGKLTPDGKTIHAHSVSDGGACDWTWNVKQLHAAKSGIPLPASSSQTSEPSTPDMVKPPRKVKAEGVGVTSDEALKNAFMAAVRQVVGAVVEQDTVIEKDAVIRDEIVAHSRGFIVGYDKLSEKAEHGLIRVTIRATVERSKVVRELQVAKISTRKVDPAIIIEEAEDEQKRQKLAELQKKLAKEQQEQATKLFARALETIPESLIEAKIVGDPRTGDVNGPKVSLSITVRFSVNMQAYDTFLDRLKKSLDGLSVKQGEFTMVSRSSTHDKHQLPSSIDGFSGVHSPDEALLAVNTHRTQSHDRTEWSTYVLPIKAASALRGCSGKPLRVKLSLVDAKGGLVAADRFEGSVDGYGHPNVVYFGEIAETDNHRQGTGCEPLAKLVWVISPYLFTTSNLVGRRVIGESYQTTLDIVRTITLDLEEVKRIQDVRCELFWGTHQ
jgi:hypothetical protein